MRREIVNGFVMKYQGPFFPMSQSNQITYECFCLWGGLENDRLFKVVRSDGSCAYYDLSRR